MVAFDLGGLTEIVGENQRGILCPPFDRAKMRDAVTRILGDAELEKTLGEAGREWVKASCNKEDFLLAMKDVYVDAISRFKPGGA